MTKDIKFHIDSLKLFNQLRAKYMFENTVMRKQLNEIIVYHQNEIKEAESEIDKCKRILKKISVNET